MIPWNLALKLMQLPPPAIRNTRDVLLQILAKRNNTVQGIRLATNLNNGEIRHALGQLAKEGLVKSKKELRGANMAVVWELVEENKDDS